MIGLSAVLINLLAPPAQASGFIVEVGPQVELMVAGTWGRVIAEDDGSWMYAFGRNGDYWVAPLEKTGASMADWDLVTEQEIQLTSHGDLKDHAIRRCPDGSFLHVASANVEQPNDTAYAFHYDADWQLLGSASIEEREPSRAHNDMPLLCSDVYTGTAFSGMGGPGYFFPIDLADLSSTRGPELPMQPPSTGAAMLADPEQGVFYFVGANFEGDLVRLTLDPDLNVIDIKETPIAEAGNERTYWPQGLLKVGDYFVVAMMSRDNSWPGDDGNVLLIVLDDAWDQLYERVDLTSNPSDDLGMRPWLARSGSTLLMSYDRQREHTVVEIELDLAAFGLEPGEDDTGGGSGTDGEDTGGNADSEGKSGCGCSGLGAGAPLGALLLPLVALARRRR